MMGEKSLEPKTSNLPACRRGRELRTILTHIPPLTMGRLGRPGDPVNLLFIGSGEHIRRALQEAGWTEIPGTILKSIWMGIW
ncbi:MAG: LssY C-terminal domain-containing protein, partial [Elusimicrobia bacterium]|nr:LssY C-terminal domain-containing protein [Elusimicrobiota bacterium]